MEINIVTNFRINNILKQGSKYYKVSLGLSSTQENGGDRIYSKKDEFAFFYNTRYKTTVHRQGTIGNITFYTDHYITQDQIAFYYGNEEYIFDFEEKMVKERGVDFYLGHLIKVVETELKHDESKKTVIEEVVEKPQPDSLKINPGAVKFSDLKAYLEKKGSERLKI